MLGAERLEDKADVLAFGGRSRPAPVVTRIRALAAPPPGDTSVPSRTPVGLTATGSVRASRTDLPKL